MKIAFTARGIHWDSPMDPRFGRTEYLLIYDEESQLLIPHDNRTIESEAHGAGTKTAQLLYEMKPDVLVTGNGPGDNAAQILAMTSIKIFTGAGEMSVKSAYEAYLNNQLHEN